MNRADGSYQFDRFDGDVQTQERRRLNDRARVLQSLDRKILQAAGLTPTMEVLDLGCGTGRLSIEIAEFLTSGKVVGIDRSAGIILAARSALKRQSIANLTFQESSSENIDLPDASCDFVYARLLFQHLSKPQLTLAEIRRVLKPGGIVCIVDVDDNLTMFYPPIASMSAFQQEFDRTQTQQGGDSQVGRKLGNYLATSGFDRIKTAIEMVTSDALREPEDRSPVGMKAFLDLLSFGAAFEHQNPELIPLAARFKCDAYKLLDLPYAWGCFGLFVVTGVK